jgi:glucose/arabinose dehydrogenase
MTATALAVLGIAAGSPGHAVGQLKLQKVGSFDQPTYVDSTSAFRGLLYVVEQPGRVSVVRNGQRLNQPLLDIRGRVSCCGERGLFSIAFDPNFGRNHLFYVYYTNRKGSIEIDEFRAPSGTRALATSRRKVMVIAHPRWANHNGGQLQFGPDGYLYAGTGDGGGSGDSEDNARHLNVLLGKLLRINPHRQGTHPYTVPPTNPFVGRAGRDEIYSYGLRNPWRFAFNFQANTLAIGDVGQGSQEEVDYVKIPAASGANFGWPMWEGTFKLSPGRPDPNLGALPPVFPILTYTHARGCAIVGGYVVRDPSLESLKGRYLYTDLCDGVIRRVAAKPSGASGDRSTGLHVNIPSSFGEGAGGRIYVTSLNGPVYRLRQIP